MGGEQYSREYEEAENYQHQMHQRQSNNNRNIITGFGSEKVDFIRKSKQNGGGNCAYQR